MQTANFVQGLVDELMAVASLAPDEGGTAAVARQLARALEASAARSLLDALSEATVEINAQLGSGHVEVRLVGRDPELVYVEEESSGAAAADDSTSARISLRLPDSLKGAIESAAAREGLSVNSWIVRALGRATSGGTTRASNRLVGYARG